ncbi:MAG: FAD-dependent oxidoreductase [Micavibrio sp.]|nr:MAG: FAD-dependent oxidoreductase [Micavibrio sp.]
MKKGSKILISGAGIAGLTAAIRLAKAGFKPVVVEKSEATRVGGFLVALSHQAYIFAEEMGLVPDLKPYDMRIRSSSYHDRTGRNLLDLNYSKMFEGLSIIQIMRDDLAQVLYEHAKSVADIRFGDHITAIDDSGAAAKVTFASGVEEEFDVVIGTDGLHSAVRKLVFNESEYKRDYLDLHVAAFRLPNAINIDSKFATHMERDRYMAVFNTLQDDIGAVFVWANKDRSLPPPDQRHDHLLKAYEGTSATTAKVLEHCPKDEQFYMDVLSQVDMPIWHKGRAVLVGDAAHCLTLFSGRGAAAAFAGACRLCNALVAHDTAEEAFQAYEAQMRPIIEDIMPATRGAVKWYVPMSAKNHMIRDGLMRFVPNIVFRNYFKIKYSKV